MDPIATNSGPFNHTFANTGVSASRKSGTKRSVRGSIFADMPFGYHLLIGFVIRIGLIAYGTVQDRNLDVKYTDIDYHVFSDAARHVFRGTGSPFARETYRYSPLLAYILMPNELLGQFFGKLLFCLCDLLVSYLQYRMLRPMLGVRLATLSGLLWLYNPIVINISTRGNAESIMALLTTATLYALIRERIFLSALLFGLSVHFKLYPVCYAPAIVLYISRRHHLAAEYFWRGPPASNNRRLADDGGVNSLARGDAANGHSGGRQTQSFATPVRTTALDTLGPNPRFAAHTNYVFSPLTRQSVHRRNRTSNNSSTGSIAPELPTEAEQPSLKPAITRRVWSLSRIMPTFEHVEFVVVSVGTFVALTTVFYALYGMKFLNESIFYHFSRKDTQHNFSYWFYLLRLLNDGVSTTNKPVSIFGRTVLFAPSIVELGISVLGFVPQFIVCGVVNWKFRSSPLHAAFFATFAFVALNKVCTVQYFVWYMTFLPFVFISLDLSMLTQLLVIAQWGVALGNWLWQAYKYEFLFYHQNLFTVWIGSLLVLASNVVLFATLYLSVRRCRHLAISYYDGDAVSAAKTKRRMPNGVKCGGPTQNEDVDMDADNGLIEGAAETAPYLVAQKWANVFKADLPYKHK